MNRQPAQHETLKLDNYHNNWSNLLSLFLAVPLIIIEPYWIADQNECDSDVTSRIIILFMTPKTKFVKAINKWSPETFILLHITFVYRTFLIRFSPVVRSKCNANIKTLANWIFFSHFNAITKPRQTWTQQWKWKMMLQTRHVHRSSLCVSYFVRFAFT